MGKFVLRPTNTGYVFHLKAGNGETIATSQVYASKTNCHEGIASVMENAPVAAIEDQTVEGFEAQTCPKFEIYLAKDQEFRFRLLAKNGQNIAASEGYTTKASCKGGIESVVKNAPGAQIIDEE